MSILLIEDDRDLALLWREYLEAKGHPTRLAHSVADATQALTEALADGFDGTAQR